MSGPTISHPTARAQWEVAVPGLRASAIPFLASRVIVLVALGTARLCVTSFNMGASARGASRSGLLAWDAHWYERIAAHGYVGLGNGALRFFPLLPVLARSFRAVPGMPAGLAVVVVANVASLAAFVVLYRLVVFELGDEACARRAVWLLALAPPAFVLVMGYAESLLLVTSLVAILGLAPASLRPRDLRRLCRRALPASRGARGRSRRRSRWPPTGVRFKFASESSASGPCSRPRPARPRISAGPKRLPGASCSRCASSFRALGVARSPIPS